MAKGYLIDEATAKKLARAIKLINRIYPDENVTGEPLRDIYQHESRFILLDDFGGALGASRAQLANVDTGGNSFAKDNGTIYSIFNSKHHMTPRGHLWSGFAFKGDVITAGFRGDKLYAIGSGYNNLTVTLNANLAAGGRVAATPIATHLSTKSIQVSRRASLTGDTVNANTIVDVEFDDSLGIWKLPGVPCQ